MSAVAAFEGKVPRDRSGLREQLAAYGFLAPWLIGFFALTLGPALALG
jgi:multiple sugar transport system permease protein